MPPDSTKDLLLCYDFGELLEERFVTSPSTGFVVSLSLYLGGTR